MAKDLEMGYLLDFYGEVLTEKQREMLRQYYNDLSFNSLSCMMVSCKFMLLYMFKCS